MKCSSGKRGCRATWVPAGRKLHLVDVENLCGGSHIESTVLPERMDEYERVADVAEMDQMIVACSPQLVVATKCRERGAQVLIGLGVDGADVALLHAVAVPDLARRFDEVVIASGDHAFRSLALTLRLAGVVVTVVSRASALSRELATAATKVAYMSELPEPVGEACVGRAA